MRCSMLGRTVHAMVRCSMLDRTVHAMVMVYPVKHPMLLARGSPPRYVLGQNLGTGQAPGPVWRGAPLPQNADAATAWDVLRVLHPSVLELPPREFQRCLALVLGGLERAGKISLKRELALGFLEALDVLYKLCVSKVHRGMLYGDYIIYYLWDYVIMQLIHRGY